MPPDCQFALCVASFSLARLADTSAGIWNPAWQQELLQSDDKVAAAPSIGEGSLSSMSSCIRLSYDCFATQLQPSFNILMRQAQLYMRCNRTATFFQCPHASSSAINALQPNYNLSSMSSCVRLRNTCFATELQPFFNVLMHQAQL